MNVRLTSRIVLAVALLLGLLTALLVVTYINAKTRPAPVVTRPEVVAAEAIPAGAVVTTNMLQVRQVPPQYLVPGAATETTSLLGGIAKEDIATGEPVLLAEIASPTAGSGLAFIIPSGDVALTVSVDPLAGQDGMLRPGDRVDVIGVITPGSGITARSVATPLRGVQVLAVGNATDPGSAAKGGYSTVTLAVDSQEAEEIVYIERFESLTLTLEPPAQTSPGAVAPFTQGSMEGVAG